MISCRHCGERTYPHIEVAIGLLFAAGFLVFGSWFVTALWFNLGEVAGVFVAMVLSAAVAGPFLVRELNARDAARKARAAAQSDSPWSNKPPPRPSRSVPARGSGDDTDDDE